MPDVLVALIVMAAVAAVVGMVAAPLRRGAGAAEEERVAVEVADLEARRDAIYRQIREAELDFRTGKLSKDDHRAIDRELRGEAIGVLRELDRYSGS